MSSKLCPKVILEGTRLTFKTEIAFRLNEHPRFVGPRKYRYHSPLISAEWCAFTNDPWGRGLSISCPSKKHWRWRHTIPGHDYSSCSATTPGSLIAFTYRRARTSFRHTAQNTTSAGLSSVSNHWAFIWCW